MASTSIQLLDHRFDRTVQQSLWSDLPAPSRYVVRLHQATRLHFDIRLQLFGELFSFYTDVQPFCTPVKATRTGDHDLESILSERVIDEGKYGAGPTLVWDHGIYRTTAGTEEEVYKGLLKGNLEISLHGIRLDGRFQITGRGEDWLIRPLSVSRPGTLTQHSVLSGRTLDQIDKKVRPPDGRVFLWLEWKHFYADWIPWPQAVLHDDLVVDLNFAAQAAGVVPGMTPPQAKSVCPDCQFKPWNPDTAKTDAFLKYVHRLGHKVVQAKDNTAVVELTGRPDPYSAIGSLVEKLTRKPFGWLRYGVGPEPCLARLAAQSNDPFAPILSTNASLQSM